MGFYQDMRDIWWATRAHQIRQYIEYRHVPILKSHHRKAALDYARRCREIERELTV